LPSGRLFFIWLSHVAWEWRFSAAACVSSEVASEMIVEADVLFPDDALVVHIFRARKGLSQSFEQMKKAMHVARLFHVFFSPVAVALLLY
jgi:hypothetical protein